MTPRETKFLFLAIYFSIQGVAMAITLVWMWRKGIAENDKEKGIADYDNSFGFLVFLKMINSVGFVHSWSRFLDPEGDLF